MLLATKDELCSGCRTCQVACSLTLFGVVNPKKAALSVRGRFPAPGSYHLYTCNQCGECAAVCPVEAIAERDGVFIIDPATCTNCGLCVESCPRSAMFTHPALPHPIKCTACGECVRYCPRGAVYDAHGEVSRK